MLWSEVLNNWKNGVIFKYPKELKDQFEWNTSVLKNSGQVEYKESFKTNDKLPKNQNTTEFKEYIKKSTNNYVTTFQNLSKDAILVIPMPVNDKNYATLKDFIDNAPEIQQQEFWKEIAKVAKQFIDKKINIWISVSGLSVPYTHVRISIKPKYYFDNELKKY